MPFTTLEHLGHDEMPAKNAAAFKKLQETRRAVLLKMAKKMKLKVPGTEKPEDTPLQVDLVEAIARKKGYFNG